MAYCEESKKFCHETKSDSEKALRRLSKKGGNSYKCKFCGKWHHTSWSKSMYEKVVVTANKKKKKAPG